MNLLKKLVKARWFPTVTKPLLSGLAASGIVYGLHALGITSFATWQVNSAVTPLVGFLVAAIVQKSGGSTPVGTVQVHLTAATHTATYKPEVTLGKTIAGAFLDGIAQQIDADPTLLQGVAAEALQRVLNPAQIPAPQGQLPAQAPSPTGVPHLPQT